VVRVTAVTQAAIAIILGCGFGLGALLILGRMPRWGAPRLVDRIAPYVRDMADPLGLTPLRAPLIDPREMWRGWRDRLARTLSGSALLTRRLRQARWQSDATGFRARQLGWALAGLGIGGAITVVLAVAGRFWAGSALLPVIGAAAAVVLTDMRLSASARSRVARIQEELPTVLEFLSLCLAAGEGILEAVRRVAAAGVGDLTGELRAVVVAVDTGTPLPEALTSMARDLDVPALSRSVDHLVAALDRGAPLSQVLQAQASDAREDAKRLLIEQAGRKEIVMLFPLVFLILPLSVIFAIFPGVFLLRVGIG
jgi:tight adherence protein C